MPAPSDRLLADLIEWIRIPSISSGGGDPADLRHAADWAAERIVAAGGSCELLEGYGNPLVVGELRAARADAPTVLIYGHYDVQSADPRAAWTSDPFEPTVRDGRLFGRGASDDKGNFLPLLHVACELAAAGTLAVNVRVLCEGDEEALGEGVLRFVDEDARGADCAIVFDGDMLDERTPALTLAVRGTIACRVVLTTGARTLHSGVFGNAALNATHALVQTLAAVLPGPDGLLPAPLRAGIRPPSPSELEAWRALPPGDGLLAAVGAAPSHPAAGSTFYERTWANASLDVSGIDGGDAQQQRTIIPHEASARLNVRLAAGQDPQAIRETLEQLLRAAAPAGATLEFSGFSMPGASFDPEAPALRLAAEALGRTCGVPCVLKRSGGSIPVLAAFAKRSIPVICSGFALEDDRIHASDESYRIESLGLGELAAHELYASLATLAG